VLAAATPHSFSVNKVTFCKLIVFSNFTQMICMKTFCSLLFIFIYSNIFSQNYIPMNLDTSSFWVLKYYHYTGINGFPEITEAERISFVQGDTIITGNTYHKIVTYTSDYNVLKLAKILAKGLQYDNISYVREDTALKKMYFWDGVNDTCLIDFSLLVGDTVTAILGYGSIVDSVNYTNYFGIQRKNTYFGSQFAFQNFIDGVGAIYNFPIGDIGEWGSPVYSLICYRKNNSTLYSLYPNDSCIKKPKAAFPTSLQENTSMSVKYSFENNIFSIWNEMNESIQMNIISISGERIFRFKINSDNYSHSFATLPSGVYFVSLTSSKGTQNIKVLVTQ
jgi:hypothetical protein